MSDQKRKVIIVPCSGIGKSYGTVSREAAYEVTEDSRPGDPVGGIILAGLG